MNEERKHQLIICLLCMILVFVMVVISLPIKSNDKILSKSLITTSTVMDNPELSLQGNYNSLLVDTDNGISNKDLILLIPCGIILLLFSVVLGFRARRK